ncbi:reverse transcriptase [Corchorus capsularis]|uniref:Reverse transcriptase n=1 Tax=Corchorus capsularis TaxID=210143 RepID=A0A1R3G2Z0_COCAP|nr:reverse transcriptase [Corchorus capsularis]
MATALSNLSRLSIQDEDETNGARVEENRVVIADADWLDGTEEGAPRFHLLGKLFSKRRANVEGFGNQMDCPIGIEQIKTHGQMIRKYSDYLRAETPDIKPRHFHTAISSLKSGGVRDSLVQRGRAVARAIAGDDEVGEVASRVGGLFGPKGKEPLVAEIEARSMRRLENGGLGLLGDVEGHQRQRVKGVVAGGEGLQCYGPDYLSLKVFEGSGANYEPQLVPGIGPSFVGPMMLQEGPEDMGSGSKQKGQLELGLDLKQASLLVPNSGPNIGLDSNGKGLSGTGHDTRGIFKFTATNRSGSKRAKPTYNNDFGPDIYSPSPTGNNSKFAIPYQTSSPTFVIGQDTSAGTNSVRKWRKMARVSSKYSFEALGPYTNLKDGRKRGFNSGIMITEGATSTKKSHDCEGYWELILQSPRRGLVQQQMSRTVRKLAKFISCNKPSILFLSETKKSSNAMEWIRVCLGYDSCLAVNCRGSDLATAWRFIGFYGRPETHRRNESWQLIRTLKAVSNLPWLLSGDFNEILRSDEKIGGLSRLFHQMDVFRLVIEEYNLQSLPVQGPLSTWLKRINGEIVFERLDRTFVDDRWWNRFGLSLKRHLITTVSDHLPLLILVKDQPVSLDIGQRLFKALGQWNKLVFGNVRYKLEAKRREFETVYGGLAGNDIDSFDECKRELDDFIAQEEVMWRQRSKALWLKEGDCNTKYFHSVAMNRRRKNTILGIEDESGIWKTDTGEVERIVCAYYQNLFTSSDPSEHLIDSVLANLPNRIDDDMRFQLDKPYSAEEIKEAIVSKAIANRMKLVLPSIISDCQSAFVPGRMIYDNAIIAFETIHFLRGKRTGKRGHMALKLDLSKAYDRVEWSFIEKYDSIVFLRASLEECEAILGLLHEFEQVSGQQVNIDKSAILFSSNTTEDVRRLVMWKLGVQRVLEQDKYLGLPIMIGKNRKRELQFIKERLAKRVSLWQNKLFSIAGKAVMIQSVGQSILVYPMSVFCFPKGFIHELNMILAKFWWGDSVEKRKIHWKAWEELCVSKLDGRLGFRDFEAFNLALLAKQCWRIYHNPDSLCSRILKAKYFPRSNFFDAALGNNPSFVWRSLLEGRKVIEEGSRWRIGQGDFSFWHTKWLAESPCSRPRPKEGIVLSNEKVKDMINVEEKQWNVDKLLELVLDEDVSRIMCIPIPRVSRPDHTLIWDGSLLGEFTIKSAYFVARKILGWVDNVDEQQRLSWRRVWGVNTLPKVRKQVWELSAPWILLCVEEWRNEDDFWLRLIDKASRLGLSAARPLDTMARVGKRWQPPPIGRLKINVDASFCSSTLEAGLGPYFISLIAMHDDVCNDYVKWHARLGHKGREHLFELFEELCDEKGILRQLTIPGTPQQNGVVERRNRTLLDMLSVSFKSVLSTPHELLTGEKPDLEWTNAMNDEMESMKTNHVWDLVDLPPGRKTIGNKWVLKVKRKADGSIERYKARLVAKGHTQQEGVDYEETFSPVVRFASIRLILAIVANFDLELYQMDVKTAFLNGELDEEIYMDQPEAFVAKCQERKICKLKRSIYGLKQSSRQWYLRFHQAIIQNGFEMIEEDHCVYVKRSKGSFVILSLYVDDILLAGNDMEMIVTTKKWLSSNFEMKDMGEANYVLGVKILRDRSKRLLGLSQETYIKKILERFQMQNCKPIDTPIAKGETLSLQLTPKTSDEQKQMARVPYSSAVGSLISNLNLIGYTDADWGGDLDERKSTSGYAFLLNGGAITWSSKKQSCNALSTMEAEFIACSAVVQEAVWLKRFLGSLGVPSAVDPVTIHCDSMAAIAYTKDPKYHGRTKHIDMRNNYIRDLIAQKEVILEHISTSHMVADPLTKPIPRDAYVTHEVEEWIPASSPCESYEGLDKPYIVPLVTFDYVIRRGMDVCYFGMLPKTMDDSVLRDITGKAVCFKPSDMRARGKTI